MCSFVPGESVDSVAEHAGAFRYRHGVGLGRIIRCPVVLDNLDSDAYGVADKTHRHLDALIVEIRHEELRGSEAYGVFFYILDMPVDLVCGADEIHCEFIVLVSLAVVVVVYVLTEHEAVFDFAVRHLAGVIVDIVTLHFDICAARYIVLVVGNTGPGESTYRFGVLFFVVFFLVGVIALHGV